MPYTSASGYYDLRSPYNIQAGTIQSLRVVAPFSMSSYQKNTVVQSFTPPLDSNGVFEAPWVRKRCGRRRNNMVPPPGLPKLDSASSYYQVVQDPCSKNGIYLHPVRNTLAAHRELTLMKIYNKVS